MFRSHEVDITTFITLTDSDLMEIGVTAFGARKKMLLIIAGKFLHFLLVFCFQNYKPYFNFLYELKYIF